MARSSPDTGTRGQASYAVLARQRGDAPQSSPVVDPAEDFPGCASFHLPASEIDQYEGRLGVLGRMHRDGWKVREPTSIQHEGPSRQLAQMTGQFAMLRGSRIVCFGSADLVRLDAAGRERWLMQADEVPYLHPGRVRLQGRAIDVDGNPPPDMVLEVDHTTDICPRKPGIDKGGGFPAIRVLVPWSSSVRAPGLTIHVRRGEVYREEPASRAFPGWKAVKIHHAPARKSDGRLEGDAHVRALRVRRPRGGPGATWRIRGQPDLHAGLQQ